MYNTATSFRETERRVQHRNQYQSSHLTLSGKEQCYNMPYWSIFTIIWHVPQHVNGKCRKGFVYKATLTFLFGYFTKNLTLYSDLHGTCSVTNDLLLLRQRWIMHHSWRWGSIQGRNRATMQKVHMLALCETEEHVHTPTSSTSVLCPYSTAQCYHADSGQTKTKYNC